ncbi:uncharacterized protein LOC135710867, partial [Ochlerotatus camptorhynchus]|uniref:uncharacterized protein LOC135710867 n=1 Tax=Ochlerotatus camptorhynchus TaxID=644619 RepID=UPI0031D36FBC
MFVVYSLNRWWQEDDDDENNDDTRRRQEERLGRPNIRIAQIVSRAVHRLQQQQREQRKTGFLVYWLLFVPASSFIDPGGALLKSSATRWTHLGKLGSVVFSLQIGRRGECRVLAETLDGFKCLLKYLTEKKHKFFTYDTKTERVFKVVMKGLPSGESLDQIKDELAKLLGVVPLQVIKMKMKSRPGDSRNGISNDFYLVHFKSSELNNLKALEKASLMLHVRVKWEHFRKTGGNFQNLTQCRKCQGWGHGTKNCYMPAKCMNCGDSSHAKDDCPVKEDPKKFKCSNCGENHKSNFWECKTRKAILQS